ncbi:acyl carrier protein [Lactobacillus kalixensis]|uniref:Acyl carrier protein n=1 Tax=Lactobacillus kalixensis DSM 16043 TaxID=1423763 RepID=A0A0R1U756_9LACO|nr:acyl carrier protein [Lactobacillus kalixensis]KRL89052.1 hypothetical protein FC46_GL001161 [Lactobacillus kalixensis DSM 16043]
MTKEEILKDVKEIAQEELDVDVDTITLDTNIKEDLDADSLDLFEILNELEDKYDLELDADENTKTIGDLVDLVKSKMDEN